MENFVRGSRSAPQSAAATAISRVVRSGLIALVLAVFSLPVLAGALGEQVASLGDAVEKANAYSFETGGIGIIISYGTGNKGTPERLGDAFVKEIEKRGQDAKYFFHSVAWLGATISYRIGYSSLGPWGVRDAATHVGDAVKRAKAAHKVHGR